MPTRIWLLLAPKTAAQGPKPSGAGTATPAARSGKTASKTAHFRSTSRAHTAGHSGGRARPARPKHWILSVDTDCAIAPLSICGTPEPCLGDYPSQWLRRLYRNMEMAKKTYLVRFKNPAISTQPLVAHRAEIQGDHIVMFDSDGRLVALFWLAIVESWSEIPHLEAAC
jgi:hypothetical protein